MEAPTKLSDNDLKIVLGQINVDNLPDEPGVRGMLVQSLLFLGATEAQARAAAGLSFPPGPKVASL